MGKTIIDGQEVFTSSQMAKNVAYPIDDEYETMQEEINTINQNLSNLETYSTEETVCGTWINGKPIYRKVITGITQAQTFIDISSLNIEQVVKLDGYIKGSLSGDPNINYAPINYYQDASTFICSGVNVASKQFFIIPNIEFYTSKPYTVILEYTKTTE